ncbi:MAG: hypothetical protein PHD98_01235, partial [Bacilli bacterium]|nr:hypothetical protein [Bacilli bacterium]
NGEMFEVASSSFTSLEYEFNCSFLTKNRVWYDLIIKDKTTDIEYGLPDIAMERNNLTIAQRRYGFKEWSGLAKIAFEDLDYYGVSADLELISNVPSLSINGFMDIESTCELKINYWNGSESVTLETVSNTSVDKSAFSFAFDLRLLVSEGVYYDVAFYINGEKSDLTSDMALNYAQTISHANRIYRFEKWEGLLKIAFTTEV